MAGAIHASGDGRYRLGQDNRREYGDGLIIFRIEDLSADTYAEIRIGELRFVGVRGPHTLNVRRRSVTFDFYANRFSLFAGAHRLQSFLARQSESHRSQNKG